MFQKPFYNFLYSLFLVLITAGFCSYFNRVGMENFYSQINLSGFTPPNAVFPIVWIVLYALLVFSFDDILNSGNKERIRAAATVFTLNLFLQVLWTYVFFYNAYFFGGLVVLVILDLLTMIMFWLFYEISHIAGLTIIPYFIWLLFATYLNWAVVVLNA